MSGRNYKTEVLQFPHITIIAKIFFYRYNHPMIRPLRKRQFYPLVAALLVFAVFGSLVFSKAEMSNNFETEGKKPYSKGVFSPFDHTVYWLVEETSILSKAKKNSFSAMWNGMPRILMPVEISTAECLSTLSIYITHHIYFSNINNAIPLKLRI
jgi:hypothetical protein